MSRSTAGRVPCTTNRTEPGSRPYQPASSNAARVAASFCGEVRTYQGRPAPWRARSAAIFAAWVAKSTDPVIGACG